MECELEVGGFKRGKHCWKTFARSPWKNEVVTAPDFSFTHGLRRLFCPIQDAPVEHVVPMEARRNPRESAQVRDDAFALPPRGRHVLPRLSGQMFVLLADCEMPKPGLGHDSAFLTNQHQIPVRHREQHFPSWCGLFSDHTGTVNRSLSQWERDGVCGRKGI